MNNFYIDDYTNYLSNDKDAGILTIRNHTKSLRLFYNWYVQCNETEPKVEEVTPLDLRRYRDDLQSRLKPLTVRSYFIPLRVYFQWAVNAKKIALNPAMRIKLPQDSTQGFRWLDKQQQWKLIQAVEKNKLAAMAKENGFMQLVIARRMEFAVVFLFNTGLRLAEFKNLKRSDIQLSERKGTITIKRGKGNKRREIPLNHTALTVLKAWLNDSYGDGEKFAGDNFIVDCSMGRISDAIRQAAFLAKITCTPHTLRHTFAKNLADEGESLQVIATLMGHANVNITMRYVSPSHIDLERAVSKISLDE